MIASLRGKLIHRETDCITIDVGGVGYQVRIPLSTYYKLPQTGEDIFLYTAMIVREDIISLYGFLSLEEKRLFLLLLSVSKVGPKLALNFLSGMDVQELSVNIQSENVLAIKSIPGVGLKTAERLILELKGKISREKILTPAGISALEPQKQRLYEDVLAALMALGYRRQEAEKAVRKSLSSQPQDQTMENVLKNSLIIMAKRNKK